MERNLSLASQERPIIRSCNCPILQVSAGIQFWRIFRDIPEIITSRYLSCHVTHSFGMIHCSVSLGWPELPHQQPPHNRGLTKRESVNHVGETEWGDMWIACMQAMRANNRRGSDVTATRISTATTSDEQLMRGWRASTISTLCIVVEWLFVLVIAILPIDAYIFLPGTQSGIFLSEVLTAQAFALFVVGYGLALLWHIPFPLSFPIRWLAPLGALLGASLISLLFAHARGVGLRECAQYTFFLVLFLLACAVARQQGIRNRVFWAILAGYYVVIILGL